MDAGKICYFEVVPDDGKYPLIRFGVCRRPEAQIVTNQNTWEKIVSFIIRDGYRLVEIRPNGFARVS
jgi:hypothetical protein